jgi:hypothetical protein
MVYRLPTGRYWRSGPFQLFILALAATGLMLGAAVSERRRLALALADSEGRRTKSRLRMAVNLEAGDQAYLQRADTPGPRLTGNEPRQQRALPTRGIW